MFFYTIFILAHFGASKILDATGTKVEKVYPRYPPQNTRFLNGEYVTFPDRQLGEGERDCIPRDEATEEQLQAVQSNTLLAEVDKPPFNDTTPFNGTEVVEEPMVLRIFKPLCDD